MGCSSSKEASKVKTSGNSPGSPSTSSIKTGSSSNPQCHFCKQRIPAEEFNQHTVTCDEREVTCQYSWCREVLKQKFLQEHMEHCVTKQKTICSKCGAHLLVIELQAHRDSCHLEQCSHCGEKCIARILKYCPVQILGKLNITNGPFASETLRAKYKVGLSTSSSAASLLGATNNNNNLHLHADPNSNAASPLASTGTITRFGTTSHSAGVDMANIHYNVARLQLLWRWTKVRAILEDAIFRLVHKEMDLKKEGFAIFRAHDRNSEGGMPVSAPRKSRSEIKQPVVAPSSSTHYFPANPSVPITLDHVRMMIQDLTNHTLLPYTAAWRVFTNSLQHFNTLHNVVRLMPPVGARVVGGRTIQGGKTIVVGDLHGQLQDLLHILNECGLPDDSTYYVFNGDFVDRGPQGVEVLLVLFSLMLACPKYVSLNRGNHECDYMNEEYGFDVEVNTKYDRQMYKLIQRCFCALPLATMVGEKVFIVHGGLPRQKGVKIEDIQRIQRFRQVPMPEQSQPEEDEMFQDMLWSDPHDQQGWQESERGAGVNFGPDVTNAFLENNQLDLIIRSHEEFMKGYEEHHNKKLVTVFSASNYSGPDSNKGSWVVLVGENPEPSYYPYQVYEDELEEMQATVDMFGADMTFNGTFALATPTARPGSFYAQSLQPKKRVRDEVMRVLRERIYRRRHRLLAYFTKLDRTRKGTVWKIEWVETLRNVLNMELPWYFLRQYLASEDDDSNRIQYCRFLAKYECPMRELWLGDWEEGMIRQVACRVATTQKGQLAAEPLRSHNVNYNEFCGVMRSLDYTISDAQLFQLFLGFDTSFEGFIDGNALLEEFQNVATSATAVPVNPLRWDLETMEQLQVMLIQGRTQLRDIFKITAKERYLTLEKFTQGLRQLGRGMRGVISPQQVQAMYTFLQEHCANLVPVPPPMSTLGPSTSTANLNGSAVFQQAADSTTASRGVDVPWEAFQYAFAVVDTELNPSAMGGFQSQYHPQAWRKNSTDHMIPPVTPVVVGPLVFRKK